MVKKAMIFKGFRISESSAGVRFFAEDSVEFFCKNDNFATQVQVYDGTALDFFDYKYLTFDKKAIFEITDCIQSELYTTLFIQYVSTISLAAPVADLYVRGVSTQTLQRFGFNVTEFMRIVGSAVHTDTVEVQPTNVCYALKIRLSEIPQNLKEGLTPVYGEGETWNVDNYGTRRGLKASRIANPATPATPITRGSFVNFDNAVTAFLFIPIADAATLTVVATPPYPEHVYSYSFGDFLEALRALVSDLTLTIELTAVDNYSLWLINGSGNAKYDSGVQVDANNGLFLTFRPLVLRSAVGATTGTPISDFYNPFQFIRLLAATSHTGHGAAVILTEATADTNAGDAAFGFWEAKNFIQLSLPELAANEAYTSLSILGNIVDLSALRRDYIYIKREDGALRIYIDYEQGNYIDIDGSFEFAKDAYSNYDAYRAANIDLVHAQQRATLEQMQEQQRASQNLKTTMNAINTVGNTATGALKGFMSTGNAAGAVVGGVTEFVKGAANIAASEIEFNMQQQNAVANLELAQAQEREAAQATILPSSDIRGSVDTETAFNSGAGLIFAVARKIQLTDTQLVTFSNYVFENKIVQHVVENEPYSVPAWWIGDEYFQFYIDNKNPRNTRKGLIVFARK